MFLVLPNYELLHMAKVLLLFLFLCLFIFAEARFLIFFSGCPGRLTAIVFLFVLSYVVVRQRIINRCFDYGGFYNTLWPMGTIIVGIFRTS